MGKFSRNFSTLSLSHVHQPSSNCSSVGHCATRSVLPGQTAPLGTHLPMGLPWGYSLLSGMPLLQGAVPGVAGGFLHPHESPGAISLQFPLSVCVSIDVSAPAFIQVPMRRQEDVEHPQPSISSGPQITRALPNRDHWGSSNADPPMELEQRMKLFPNQGISGASLSGASVGVCSSESSWRSSSHISHTHSASPRCGCDSAW